MAIWEQGSDMLFLPVFSAEYKKYFPRQIPPFIVALSTRTGRRAVFGPDKII